MTRTKLQELRKALANHELVRDVSVIVVPTKDHQGLLDALVATIETMKVECLCGKVVVLSGDKTPMHEAINCTGSSMEYKTCRYAGKEI